MATLLAFSKCLFFRTRHINEAIIQKVVRLCFPQHQFTPTEMKEITKWLHTSFRSFRAAMRKQMGMIAKQFIDSKK